MAQVNMLEAKTKLSKLVEAVETGKEREIIIARNGRPVARIMPLEHPAPTRNRRLGLAEGQFGDLSPETLAQWDQEFDAMWAEALSKPLFPADRPAPKTRLRKKSA
jgi:prevent-host-death family protein